MTPDDLHERVANLPASLRTSAFCRIVKQEMAALHKVRVRDLDGPSRNITVVAARHAAMRIIRSETKLSLPQIGKLFGRRDHSTVLNAINKKDRPVRSNVTLSGISDARRQRAVELRREGWSITKIASFLAMGKQTAAQILAGIRIGHDEPAPPPPPRTSPPTPGERLDQLRNCPPASIHDRAALTLAHRAHILDLLEAGHRPKHGERKA